MYKYAKTFCLNTMKNIPIYLYVILKSNWYNTHYYLKLSDATKAQLPSYSDFISIRLPDTDVQVAEI